jgi:ribonuclease HI
LILTNASVPIIANAQATKKYLGTARLLIEVYSDGSATTADLPGGWGFVICVNGIKVAEGSGHMPKATNNVAEITAAISGLEYVATHDLPGVDGSCDTRSIVLISDSQLVLHFADSSWNCKKPHLLPYVLKLRKLYRELNATTRWVKGHAGDEQNERCDVLAKHARTNGPAGKEKACAVPADGSPACDGGSNAQPVKTP